MEGVVHITVSNLHSIRVISLSLSLHISNHLLFAPLSVSNNDEIFSSIRKRGANIRTYAVGAVTYLPERELFFSSNNNIVYAFVDEMNTFYQVANHNRLGLNDDQRFTLEIVRN